MVDTLHVCSQTILNTVSCVRHKPPNNVFAHRQSLTTALRTPSPLPYDCFQTLRQPSERRARRRLLGSLHPPAFSEVHDVTGQGARLVAEDVLYPAKILV